MNFTLHNPTRLIFGPGSISKLSKEIEKIEIKKPLLVIGKGSIKRNGILEKVLNLLKDYDIKVFEGIPANPDVEDIIRAKDFFIFNNCDSVIGLGGGSVMDASKVISLVAKEKNDPWEYTQNIKPKEAYPIITIPTVAATGSEADPIAVINNNKIKEKRSISGMPLYPVLSIVDPELTITTPINVSIDGFVDIIAHVSETFISTKERNIFCDGITETIIKMIIENAPIIIKDPTNIKARTDVSLASTMAMFGILYPRSGGWPLHAIEHSISGFYPEISHGPGLAAILPGIVEWNANKNLERIKQYLKIFGKEIKDNKEARKGIEDFLKSINAYKRLRDIGIRKEDIEKIAEKTLEIKGNKEKTLLNIEPMHLNDIIDVLKACY